MLFRSCDFLTRWPTLAAVQRARATTLRRFYHAHNCRKADVIAARLAAIAAAQPLTTDPAVIAPLQLAVQTYATQSRTVLEAVQRFVNPLPVRHLWAVAAASGVGWTIDVDAVPLHPAAEVSDIALASGEEPCRTDVPVVPAGMSNSNGVEGVTGPRALFTMSSR